MYPPAVVVISGGREFLRVYLLFLKLSVVDLLAVYVVPTALR